jgi:hypothetical protein
MQSAGKPKAWTSVAAAQTMALPKSWSDYKPPQQLHHSPDDVMLPIKLLEILEWSLERGGPPDNALPKAEDDTHVAEAPVSNNIGPVSEPRLQAKTSGSDFLAAALNKITTLKSKKPADPMPKTPPKPAIVTEECTSCFDDISIKELVRLSCTHYYCKACLGNLVMTAIQTESMRTSSQYLVCF